MNPPLLTVPQTRVVGCLVEKQLTTPMGYPMTPNAVRIACNQKSNRDPVVEYDDDLVFDTLKALEKRGYVESGLLDGTQTVKYRHCLEKAHDLARGEVVILCELFNRGAQTPGELRARCERMHRFADRDEVERCLVRLAEKALIVMLDRLPGTKENRWAHRFCGEPVNPAPARAAEASGGTPDPGLADRVAALEEQVRRLGERLDKLVR